MGNGAPDTMLSHPPKKESGTELFAQIVKEQGLSLPPDHFLGNNTTDQLFVGRSIVKYVKHY